MNELTNTQQEKKDWVKPEVEFIPSEEVQGGGIRFIPENALYRVS